MKTLTINKAPWRSCHKRNKFGWWVEIDRVVIFGYQTPLCVVKWIGKVPDSLPCVTQWVAVEDELPPIDILVWLFERGHIYIGCRFETEGTWMWARNYDGISFNTKEWDTECEMEDIQPTKWAKLPESPCG
jgi:hypothetical protein